MFDSRLLEISFDALTSHRLRTFLTMLGVIFGVGAVIAMLSIGEGAKKEALEQISILGINNIIIEAQAPDLKSNTNQGIARSPGLGLADAINIADFDNLVANVVPQRFEAPTVVSYGSSEAGARVVATTPDYTVSSSVEVEYGRFIDPLDEAHFSQICVLGANTKKALFAFEDAIGKTIRIGDMNFTVVGVMADKYIARGKVEGFELKDLNEDVYIPFSTALKKMERHYPAALKIRMTKYGPETTTDVAFNIPELDQLTVTAKDISYVEPVTKLVKSVLNRRHFGVDDFRVVVPESLLRQTEKTQEIFNIVMGAIAGISLLVGGIGIMNIMLATVLERTREIGVRRAVGATQLDIMRQFLVEAIAICLLGCLVGVALGLLLAKVIAYYADWPTVVSIFSIILSVGVSTAVGVIFGLYPARKAARLNVIDALRYE